jgi:hypothetical protein
MAKSQRKRGKCAPCLILDFKINIKGASFGRAELLGQIFHRRGMQPLAFLLLFGQCQKVGKEKAPRPICVPKPRPICVLKPKVKNHNPKKHLYQCQVPTSPACPLLRGAFLSKSFLAIGNKKGVWFCEELERTTTRKSTYISAKYQRVQRVPSREGLFCPRAP